jgi:hypothetical protein
MNDFRFRTEDIRPDEIKDLFIETTSDRRIIELLKSIDPVILEGSRGIGKSFLLRMAEYELQQEFNARRILPVYLVFAASSFVHAKDDPQQFQHWMLASICYQLLRVLRKKGLLIGGSFGVSLLSENRNDTEALERKFKNICQAYENSYKNNQEIDLSELPSIENFKDAVEEICQETNVSRIFLFFDEAIHVFRPEQQRQFFTLFRDLRSPYISCKAAVYPGVTSYGHTFEMAHDATFQRIEREIKDEQYLEDMKELVFKQAGESLQRKINKNMQNFNVLAYSASGNPRALLKTINKCLDMNSQSVNTAIKDYYRTDIWVDHTRLGEKYKGHKSIVDWGRNFIEEYVLPATQDKNNRRAEYDESTCYFWIHRDVPEIVKEAIRLLEYTGIVKKRGDAIRGTDSEFGTRYEIKLGCVLAMETSPVQVGINIAKNLFLRRYTEYGMNNPLFHGLSLYIESESEDDLREMLNYLLSQPIQVLDLNDWQKNKLRENEISTIRELLNISEEEMINRIYYVGEKRARRIRNAAIAEVLEYLSG